jgi:YHS domain-containing protein
VAVNYELALNCVGLLLFGALFLLTARRGATDPVCGMKVGRHTALSRRVGGRTLYFCSEHCLQAFDDDPGSYTGSSERSTSEPVAG